MYDVIVIGAGINGSAAAYDLKKRGKSVLLLEQVIYCCCFLPLYTHMVFNNKFESTTRTICIVITPLSGRGTFSYHDGSDNGDG